MKTKSQIVNYWIANYRETLIRFFEDTLSYPSDVSKENEFLAEDDFLHRRALYSCWACGYCTYPKSSPTIHRCHISPESLGGSNEEENLVLLCKDCHKEMPSASWMKREDAVKWILDRESLFDMTNRMIVSELLKHKEYFEKNFDESDLQLATKIIKDLMKNVVPHGKTFSKSTIAALIDKTYSHIRQFKQ